jgi:hypothetical protein
VLSKPITPKSMNVLGHGLALPLNRQSLDLATGPLINFGGASAAYSLRDLNGRNPRIVRVRRASDNHERDFYKDGINSGELTNWVNSQIVPPLDIGVLTPEGRIPVPEGGTSIGIPAAAYSLRNLSTTYTGNVVDVRRSSDDAEDSFTAAEVADGTLTDWVSEDTTQYMQFDGVDEDISTPALLPATDDFTFTIKFILDEVPASTMGLYGSLSSGSSGRNVFQINTSGQAFAFISGVAALTTANSINVGAINTFVLSRSGTNWSLSLNGGTADTATGSIALDTAGSNIGDPYSGINFNGIITSLSVGTITWDGSAADATAKGWTVNGSPTSTLLNDGFVSKWYDQSGNDNHATQGTAASQPKIVDGGSLVTKLGQPSMDFTTGSTMLLSDSFSITETESAVFAIWQPAKDSATTVQARNRTLFGNASSQIYIGTPNADSQMSFKRFDAVKSFTLGLANLNTPNLHAFVGTTAGADYYFNGSSIYSDTATGTNSIRNHLRIGAKQNLATHDTEGYISELIIYDSDQSANRTAIEANIGETYGITGIPAYDNTVDGFVETWYDQSGNGNDATQSVAASQPKIVDAGVLVSGGLDFDGVDDFFGLIDLDNSNQPNTIISVSRTDVTGSTRGIYGLGSDPSSASGYYRSSNNHTIYAGIILEGSVYTSGTEYLRFDLFNGASSVIGVNGASTVGNSGNRTLTHLMIGDSLLSGVNPLNGRIRELIIYPTDQSANRVAIETNINNQYNIY